MIDLDRYTGYLKPVTPLIVDLYQTGMSSRDIAAVLYHHREFRYPPSAGMVHYILYRVGAIPGNQPPPPKPPVRIRRQRVCWPSPSNLGRPIDMGGPRDQWLEQSPWDAY